MSIDSSVTVEDQIYDVSFYPSNIRIGNDSNGGYEFWGQKGIDSRPDFVEEFDITDLKVSDAYTEEEIEVSENLREKIEDAIHNSEDIACLLDQWYYDMSSFYDMEPYND